MGRFALHNQKIIWGSVAMLLFVAACASSERTTSREEEGDPFYTVTDADIKDSPSGTIHELLEGKVAGVQVIEQNGGISIRIRGTSSILAGNEPLYIMDGFPTEPGPGNVFYINPYDIASIRVLKGSDAATYGIRGSNGVIVITTKRGGDK